MKKCPTCNRTYSDETLSFCFDDGALLSASYDPDETLVLGADDLTERVTDPSYQPDKSVYTVVSPPKNTAPPEPVYSPPEKRNNTPHFVYAIAGLLAVVMIVSGLIFLIRSPATSDSSSINKITNTSEAENAKAEKATSTPAASSNTGGEEKPILDCLTGTPECSGVNLDFGETIDASASRVLMTFKSKDSEKWKSLLYGDFSKKISNGEIGIDKFPMKVNFETVKGREPSPVKIYRAK